MNYTHRNIHSQKLCFVVDETNYHGHILYKVQAEGEGRRQIWTRTAFRTHHVELATKPTAAAIVVSSALLVALLILLWLPYVGGAQSGGSATGCGQDDWPACRL